MKMKTRVCTDKDNGYLVAFGGGGCHVSFITITPMLVEGHPVALDSAKLKVYIPADRLLMSIVVFIPGSH